MTKKRGAAKRSIAKRGATKRSGAKRTKQRRRSGPRTGASYQSAEVIKEALIDAVVSLLGEGIRVAKLTSRQVTERASLDKMYVSRFFGNLDGLLFAVLENLLAARMRSLISSDVFALGRPNTNVIRAFEIYSYLARDEELEPRLRQLAEVVIAVYKNQLSAEFGLEDKEAAREAVIGLVWLVGHLSVGHLMPMQPSELDSMMAGRRNQLRNRAR